MNTELQQHFQNIQQIIRQGKVSALKTANAYSLIVNWYVGAYLSQRLSQSIYGDKVVDGLSEWLSVQEP